MSRSYIAVSGIIRSYGGFHARARRMQENKEAEEDDEPPNIRSVTTDRLLKLKYFVIFCNAMLGIVLMICELQAAWDFEKQKIIETKTSRNLRIAISVTTGVLLIQILDYYFTLVRGSTTAWKESQNVLVRESITKMSVLSSHQTLTPAFWTEMVLCSLHTAPIPWLPDKFGLIMFLRLYMLFRIARDNSVLYRWRTEISKKYEHAGHHRIKKRQHDVIIPPKFTWQLAFKSYYFQMPGTVVALFLILMLFVTGYSIYVFEREVDPVLNTFEGGFYLSFISFVSMWPTDAYYVYFPMSTGARINCIISTTTGYFILAYWCEVFGNWLAPTNHQKPALTWVVRHENKLELRQAAASLIQLVWMKYLQRKHHRKNKQDHRDNSTCCGGILRYPVMAAYLTALKEFRDLRRDRFGIVQEDWWDKKADMEYLDDEEEEEEEDDDDDDDDGVMTDPLKMQEKIKLMNMEQTLRMLTRQIDAIREMRREIDSSNDNNNNNSNNNNNVFASR